MPHKSLHNPFFEAKPVRPRSFASEASLASKGDRLPQKANSTRPIVRVLSVSLTCPLVIGLGHSEFFT